MLQDATLSSNVQDLIETPVGSTMPLFNSCYCRSASRAWLSSSSQIKSALTLLGVAGGDAGIAKLLGRKVVNKTGPAVPWPEDCSQQLGLRQPAWGVINTISARQPPEGHGARRRVISCSRAERRRLSMYAGNVATLDAYHDGRRKLSCMGPILVEWNHPRRHERSEHRLQSKSAAKPTTTTKPNRSSRPSKPRSRVVSFSRATDKGSLGFAQHRIPDSRRTAQSESDLPEEQRPPRSRCQFEAHSVSRVALAESSANRSAGAKQLTRVRCILNSPDGTVSSADSNGVDVCFGANVVH
jgi:hypothetical protein